MPACQTITPAALLLSTALTAPSVAPGFRAMLTMVSSNSKTGPIPVSTTSRNSCPTTCALRGSEGCYGECGPLAWLWTQLDRGDRGGTWEEFCAQVATIKPRTLFRHDQAGDLPHRDGHIIPEALSMLVQAARRAQGYTYNHHLVDADHIANRVAIARANASGFVVNLSGNNPAHADTLADLGIGPAATVLPTEYARLTRREGKKDVWAETMPEYRARIADLPKTTPAGRRIQVCPATLCDTACADCKLCALAADHPARADKIIGFPAHGGRARKASALAAAI